MAVISEHEIELNSIKYPITRQVRPILSAKFAEKQVIGDYTKDSNPEVSSWVMQDNRGGILAEEMDEARQADRCWWSTCNLGFLGHILLPPLATTVANIATATISDEGFEQGAAWIGESGWTGGAVQRSGTWCMTVANTEAYQVLTWDAAYVSQTFHWECWVKTAVASTGRIGINDGQTTTYSSYHTGGGTYERLVVTKTLAADATRLHIIAASDTANNTHFDDANTPVAGNYVTFCNYNSKLYLAYNDALLKLNDGGTDFDLVKVMPATITDLIAGEGNHLYVFLGDGANYWYMNTAEAFTTTNVADATYGIAWDSKLFKITSAGSLSYAADPSHATPAWTDDGDLADEGLADNDVQSLFIYRDAAGNPIIYAGTKLGLYAHSFGNDKWIATELAMPQHATAGKGVVHWRDNSYISAGLDVLAYQTGGAGTTIASVGLDRDDGLPQLRGGEIVKFIKGYNEFFALVDSTYEGTGSRSTVMAYDGKGWQCWWEAAADNLHMYTGIVSTKVAHRLWFACGTNVYYIPLQKNLRNPKKVSTFAYNTAGVHITPWFDANWVGQKLALQLKIFCKDVTANETVLVDYRIDHVDVDLTTWTNLGTIVAAGNEVETTYTFGTNLGTNFKAIQFKFTLGRITTGTTPEYYSPDIQYAVLEYQKIIKPTWGWAFTIDCTKPYDGRAPEQLLDAVVTAAELETLTPFLYQDTTYYVRVKSVEGERLTGDGRKGTYNVTVLKPI